MACRIAAIPMTLSDLHLLKAFSSIIFLYICAAVDKMSTVIARSTVSLQS